LIGNNSSKQLNPLPSLYTKKYFMIKMFNRSRVIWFENQDQVKLNLEAIPYSEIFIQETTC